MALPVGASLSTPYASLTVLLDHFTQTLTNADPGALPVVEYVNKIQDNPCNYLENKRGAAHLTELKYAKNLSSVIMMTKLLLERYKDEPVFTALHVAIIRHDLGLAKLIIHLAPELIHVTTIHGIAPLFLAVEEGMEDLVPIILDPRELLSQEQLATFSPTAVNTATSSGLTALH